MNAFAQAHVRILAALEAEVADLRGGDGEKARAGQRRRMGFRCSTDQEASLCLGQRCQAAEQEETERWHPGSCVSVSACQLGCCLPAATSANQRAPSHTTPAQLYPTWMQPKQALTARLEMMRKRTMKANRMPTAGQASPG